MKTFYLHPHCFLLKRFRKCAKWEKFDLICYFCALATIVLAKTTYLYQTSSLFNGSTIQIHIAYLLNIKVKKIILTACEAAISGVIFGGFKRVNIL